MPFVAPLFPATNGEKKWRQKSSVAVYVKHRWHFHGNVPFYKHIKSSENKIKLSKYLMQPKRISFDSLCIAHLCGKADYSSIGNNFQEIHQGERLFC